jgi:Uma2 family endonuclease
MVKCGAFSDHDRFHLINGLLVEKITLHDPHATADELSGRALDRVIPLGWHVRAGKPIRLPPDSKPEPDRSVVRGEVRDYRDNSPGAGDVGLVLEVSVSSLADDRKQATVYAASGIPHYWIVNVRERTVEVYLDPTNSGYRVRTDSATGERVPVILDRVTVGEVAVDDLLP